MTPTASALYPTTRKQTETGIGSTLTERYRRTASSSSIKSWEACKGSNYKGKTSYFAFILILTSDNLSNDKLHTRAKITALRRLKTSFSVFHGFPQRLSVLALRKFVPTQSHCRGRQFEPDCPYPMNRGTPVDFATIGNKSRECFFTHFWAW